ncbi:MAG: hypothetical protein EOP11_24995 [Proteobacteria bacterium]|nr:MAG: hypothetical protein EOP11_24995 [Pseudomonadota bacterium]
MDPIAGKTWERLLSWVKLKFGPKRDLSSDLIVLQQLQAKMRGGHSLDTSIEALLSADYLPAEQKRRLSSVLQGKPDRDFLSQFLASAMESGIPLLSSLAAIQRTLLSEKKLRLKAQSMTSQARAQGEVLSWLPWVLCTGIFVMDAEWFWTAAQSPLSWSLWGIAFLLTGVGRWWMGILLRKVLSPSNSDARLEEEVLPKLVLRAVAQLSLGQDAETSLDKAWDSMEEPGDRRAFLVAARKDNALAHVQFLYGSAAQTGAPLREDLLRFLDELHMQGEARWEERVQRLPVVMMAPLFVCFFPGSLVVILALLLPLLKGF